MHSQIGEIVDLVSLPRPARMKAEMVEKVGFPLSRSSERLFLFAQRDQQAARVPAYLCLTKISNGHPLRYPRQESNVGGRL
jgi:hypothetical protein